MASDVETPDTATAAAFARSWNTVGTRSVYTRAQFRDWFTPVDPDRFQGQSVLELGFGNGSLLYHMAEARPARLVGVELGDTHEQTRRNLAHLPPGVLELHRGDLTRCDVGQFDFVYCIGVLHHLMDPASGFDAVLRHTKPGAQFHCWVYGREGNAMVIHVVDPIRRVASRLPWWFAKYAIALPLVTPFFAYARILRRLSGIDQTLRNLALRMPLGPYSLWIAERDFHFFHHVAFDQIVTPRTQYIARATVDRWLTHPEIDPSSTYVLPRNGNSWKFGGRRTEVA